MICVRQLSLECIAHLIVTFVLSDKRRRHRRLSRTTSLMLVRTTVPRPLYNYTRNTAGRLTCRRQRRRRRTTPHPFAYNMPRGSSVIIPIAQHMYYVRYATRVQMRRKRQTPPTHRAGNWTACVGALAAIVVDMNKRLPNQRIVGNGRLAFRIHSSRHLHTIAQPILMHKRSVQCLKSATFVIIP